MRTTTRWLGGGTALVLLMTVLAAQAPARAQAPKPDEAKARAEVLAMRSDGFITVPPWVQLLGDDRVGVGWMTASAGDGHVLWTQEAEGDDDSKVEWRRATSSRYGLTQGNSTIQKAVIKGYDPYKPLRFKAVSRPIEEFKPYSVKYGEPTTSNEIKIGPTRRRDGSASFIVFNDVHNNIHFYPILTPLAGDKVDFMVFNGDVLQDPQTEKEVIEHLLLPMSWFAAHSIPCFFLRGNHETRGAYARHLADYLVLPDDQYYAAMTFGAARVVFLDSGEDKPDSSKEYSGLNDFDPYMEEQRDWLAREVESEPFQSAVWRIVVQHIPPDWRIPMEKKRWYGPERVEKLFGPLYDQGGVTAIIAAHNHRADVIPPCPDESRGYQYTVFIGDAHPLSKATILRADVTPESLKITRFQSDGSIGAEQTWDKKDREP